jgi:hypothetical protein
MSVSAGVDPAHDHEQENDMNTSKTLLRTAMLATSVIASLGVASTAGASGTAVVAAPPAAVAAAPVTTTPATTTTLRSCGGIGSGTVVFLNSKVMVMCVDGKLITMYVHP